MTDRLPVLVTGGAGYIGSHAVLALADAGWPVAVIDNLVTGFRWAVPDAVPFYEGDIEDSALLARIFAEQGTGAVMHFAGSVVVPESVDDPLKYYHNNTGKTRALLASAVDAGVPHFIFSSTAATYGIPEVSPVQEDSPQRPINPYGMSKLMTEAMLADVAHAHPLNYCALRYFNVAGADPQARTGQSTAGATHLIKVAVEAALQNHPELAVGGVVGSNISNALLIIGLPALIAPFANEDLLTRRTGLIMVLVTLLFITFLWDGMLSRFEGIAMVVGLAAYILTNYWLARRLGADAAIADYLSTVPS